MQFRTANFTLTNEGIDGPADYIDEKCDLIMSMIDGQHAGYNAMLQSDSATHPMQILVNMIELDYASWNNARKLASV